MNKVDIDRRAGREKDKVWIVTVSVHRRYRDAVLDILEDAEFIDLLDEIGKTNINAFLSNLATDGDIDGLEVIKRTKTVNPDTIFIMITAYYDDRFTDSFKNAGASEVVYKPIRLNEIDDIIKKAIGR